MTYSDLAGKVVLITGGANGLGAAAAKAFLSEGCKVAIVDISADALVTRATDLGAQSDQLITIAADVSKEEDVKRYVEETVAQFGTIDVFFNNAGIEGKVAPIVDQKTEDFDRVMAINVRGCWLGLKYVLPVMYAQKSGSVINTSSIGGLVAGPMPVSPYVTSKFAIHGMTRIVANESAPYQVRVNSVHPSPANTQMMRSLESGSGAAQEDIARSIPLGRYAEGEDIANAVLFLASEKSSFITGSQFRVDGGMLS
ncbi:SDR family oxidoreductase [Mesorhizobium sp. YM1C-6-2]|uniref:SDR family NAD(P)-dependent oxidoreductase n=1 Tax=Mesorhizobium sp. YM1C-6-2 TaxID=1827501 RepID=UPI000EF1D7C6|nr:SDR family oxidoreductase [Mesorhizobium sp. YM1C-6-2]RLP23110.1 SDR family oxidoreductase [Mesorhizobium sp. YM1C-6-2]